MLGLRMGRFEALNDQCKPDAQAVVDAGSRLAL
jgi:hypothetical protein